MKKKAKKVGLTARQLVNFTPRIVKYRGGFVSLNSRIKKQYIKKPNGFRTLGYKSETITRILGEKPRLHYQTIELVKGKRVSDKGATIKVSCDCGFHTFTCEVALFRQGAADIITSNGEYPYIRNPRAIPLVCKHLLVVITNILKRGTK